MTLDFSDEVLCGNLNHVISGLLPHENYEPKTFGLLWPTLTTVLKMENVKGLHFVFFSIFDKYFSLQNSVNEENFQVRITRERFEKALANNLPDFVLEPQMDVEKLMSEEGKSSDISIPTVQNEAMGVIFSKAMDLYDTCFVLCQSYEDSMSYIVDLKDSIKANVIETGLQMQRAIVSTGLSYGRKFYRGTSGWLDFSQQLVREISEMDSSTEAELNCISLDVLNKIDSQVDAMSTGLAGYGIPQLDDFTPMLRHRLVVLVAQENTGKTKVITHLIATLIKAGVKSYFACGEAPPQLMFMQIVSSYIFQEYGMYFEPTDLFGKGFECLPEADKQLVATAKSRVALSGIIIDDALTYDNVTPTFTAAYRNGCEAFFVDHTQSLGGRKGRKIGDLVTTLTLDCRDLKKALPIYIMLSSHPSTDLKDILQKEQTKDIRKSPTAQSSTPAQEADELFILSDTDYYQKQGILQWLVYKRRGAVKPPAFFIRKLFHVSSYEYDPNIQGGESLDAKALEGFLNAAGSPDSSDDFDPELEIDFE